MEIGRWKMAGICSSNPTFSIPPFGRPHGLRCCSAVPEKGNSKPKTRPRTENTPQILKLAVSGVTQLLRLFPFSTEEDDGERYRSREEISVASVDDVVRILESDYENAYFVTGIFTSSIYAEDCVFEDPTIRFQGTELYRRNLKLLVPFFDCQSIALKNIEKGINSGANFVKATWKLRTYLKLPWRPLILIDGSTVYELNDQFKIVGHAESWNVSALEAIDQIFTPSFERHGD